MLKSLSCFIVLVSLLFFAGRQDVYAEGAPTAQEEAGLGRKALAENDLVKALAHYTKAFELEPSNQDYVHSAGVLSFNLGLAQDAVTFFKKASTLAAANGKSDDLLSYNEQISAVYGAMPEWVDLKVAESSPISPEQEGIVGIWSNIKAQVEGLLEQGDVAQSLEAAQQAVTIAKDNLGLDHYATLTSQRDLGVILLQAGELEQGEELLNQVIARASKILGASHPEVLSSQTVLTDFYEQQSRFEEALETIQEVYQSSSEGLGEVHMTTFNAGMGVARNQRNLGDYKGSENVLQPLCTSMADNLGDFHLESANCWAQFASLRTLQGDLENALVWYQKSLTTHDAVLSEFHPVTLLNRVQMAELYRQKGDYKTAEEMLLRVLSFAEQGQVLEDPVVFDAMSYLARVYDDLGDYPQAEEMTKKVFDYESKTLGRGHPNTMTTMNNLAGIYRRQSRLLEAEQLYKEVLENYRAVFGEEHVGTVTVMNNLGLVYENRGLYDEAELLLRAGLEISKKVLGQDHLSTLANMNNLALLHESQGNFEQAEPHYLNAIESGERQFGKNHPETIAFVNNLAYLYMMETFYPKAQPLFERVLESWTESLGGTHQKTLKSLNNLARSRHKQGFMEEAKPLFEKALRLRTQVLGDHHMDTLRSMHDLGVLYGDLKDYPASESLLKDTLSRAEKALGDQHPYTFEAVNSLGRVYSKQKKKSQAFNVLKSGFNRRTSFLNRMLWATGDNAREGYIRLHRPELNAYLSLLTQLGPEVAGREVLDVGLQRKGLLLKITSEIQQIVQLGANPELTDRADRLTQTRKELAALTLAGPSEETKDTHMGAIHALEKQIDTLQMKLGQASRRFRQSVAQISVDELVENLPDDAALVDFLSFRDENDTQKLLAGVLVKEGGEGVFSTAFYPDMDTIQKAVVEYRTAIQDEDVEEDELLEVGQGIYDLIWGPLTEALGDRTVIYIVPDGMLNILPFNALINPDKAYLIADMDLHILSSSRDLLSNNMEEATGEFLILAGPDYDSTKVSDKVVKEKIDTLKKRARKRASSGTRDGLRAFSGGMRGLHFDPLPGAEKEGKLISSTSKTKTYSNTILIQNDAQEQVLQSLSVPPRMLHIATHGFFLKADENLKKRLLSLQRGADLRLPPPGDNPMLRAGLAFAGINGNAQFLGEIPTENDGVLTALEVLGLDLTGTRMAVLSACETGLGEIHEGEGVYGLRRAFQEAGVATVISSLWEVSDAGTQALMTRLYSRLADGKSVYEALRGSQRELMHSGEWGYPYIWSAFMMVER